ncbi:hypothetical protein HOO65_050004 [Ceratocystis lukuohia]|uniref:DUF4412 domain-containing protein n=1 Tax=Ceratocystis lukuohia TaxID=2019550 RepID=A0ABR4MF38_9PEZI
MKASSFLTFALSFPCFGICSPAGLESTKALATIATDSAHPGYLKYHGYHTRIEMNNAITIYSDRFSGDNDKPTARLLIDTKHRVTTIQENNLRREKKDKLNLELHKIFQALCYQKSIDFNKMGWIYMDVHDTFITDFIRGYREVRGLGPKQEIRVTPDHKDWKTFATLYYSLDADKMVPGALIDKIIVRREERLRPDAIYPAVVAQVMGFSLKELPSNEESNAVDSPSESDARLESEGGVETGKNSRH